MWARYRKKPVEVEAVQVTGENLDAIAETERDTGRLAVIRHRSGKLENAYLQVRTLEGIMMVRPGDWLLRGTKGELYPCREDIFQETYEKV